MDSSAVTPKEKQAKIRCHACGQPAEKANRLGNNKLMKKHNCSHGNSCAASSPTAGLHANHNSACKKCLRENAGGS